MEIFCKPLIGTWKFGWGKESIWCWSRESGDILTKIGDESTCMEMRENLFKYEVSNNGEVDSEFVVIVTIFVIVDLNYQ